MTVATLSIGSDTTDEELQALSDEFEHASPEVILEWADEEFGSDIALATGFGVEGCLLVSILADSDVRTRVFYLDTDLLFPETYALRDQLEARYGVHFERCRTNLSLDDQALSHGAQLWARRPDECCRLRKVEPLKEMLSGLRAWITGVRRDQSITRAATRIIERDAQFGLIKISPLARWSSQDVWKYIVKHDVPYNPLHDQRYPSLGCVPCTTPVQIGEDLRAGRWRGTNKTECGIHNGKSTQQLRSI
jgi:phosphoadenosine phosphosulfate reductase